MSPTVSCPSERQRPCSNVSQDIVRRKHRPPDTLRDHLQVPIALVELTLPRKAVILTCWHLVFATLATQILARTTRLLDGRRTAAMTGRKYLRAVVPIGLFYSGSLVCSNLVYLYLSVAFIQMLKAAAPVAVLLISWAWGVEKPCAGSLANVLVIVAGVALASLGEISFSWAGFLFQWGGIVFEAMRLVMIQVLLAGEENRMDPLVSLYYYAPVCAAMNIVVAVVYELRSFQWEDLYRAGPGMLFLNAAVAFMLNVASVQLVSPARLPSSAPPINFRRTYTDQGHKSQIGKTSGLILTLTGILKNILLVIISVMIWHTAVSPLQALGYAVALAGLVYYSLGWDQLCAQSAAAASWARAAAGWDDRAHHPSSSSEPGGSGNRHLPTQIRRALFLSAAACVIIMLALWAWPRDDLPPPITGGGGGSGA